FWTRRIGGLTASLARLAAPLAIDTLGAGVERLGVATQAGRWVAATLVDFTAGAGSAGGAPTRASPAGGAPTRIGSARVGPARAAPTGAVRAAGEQRQNRKKGHVARKAVHEGLPGAPRGRPWRQLRASRVPSSFAAESGTSTRWCAAPRLRMAQ